ncbi:MAG: HAD-IIB family hydrolase [Nitrospirota bacterium]
MTLSGRSRVVIFTDLDGTLLDFSTYSFEKAFPALASIRQEHIPLVLCSSKTRKEIEYYRQKMGNLHPFISENGGGIFIPSDYFDFQVQAPDTAIGRKGDYLVIRLGAQYSMLRNAIASLKKEGFRIRGFGDMSIAEIAEVTELSISEAAMAKERDFDEPFLFEGDERETGRLLMAIKAQGLHSTRGRFFHLLGDTDKGRAVAILISLFRKKFGRVTTVAVGDNPNDIPMLEKTDYPVIVQQHDGSYNQTIQIPGLIKAEGIGPEGWNRALLTLLSAFRSGEQ